VLSVKRTFVALLVILVVLPIALQPMSTATGGNLVVDRSRTMYVVAVHQNASGSYVGTTAVLWVRVTCPGSGHVYVETMPLSEIDMQASARIAAMVASRIANVSMSSCDFYLSIRSTSPIIGGPSASLAMTVAFASALLGLPLNNSVVMTGMILPDGSVGPVGGLAAKLRAAASVGAKVFLVPYGQLVDYEYRTEVRSIGGISIIRRELVPVNLSELGRELGVRVVQVATVYEALSYATNGVFKPPKRIDVKSVLEDVKERFGKLLEKWIDVEKQVIENESARIESLVKEVENRVAEPYRSAVLRIVSSARQDVDDKVEQGDRLARQGLLYAAASSYFTALVEIKNARIFLEAVLGRNVSQSISSIEHGLKEFMEEATELVEERRRIDLGVLSLLMEIVERCLSGLEAANRSIHAIQSAQTLSQLFDASWYAAYAEARLLSVKLWMEALNESSLGFEVDRSTLDRSSQILLAYARDVASYAYAMAQDLGTAMSVVQRALELYEDARSSNTVLERLVLSIESLSYSYRAFASLFYSQNYQVLENQLNESLSYLLAQLRNVSGVPIGIALYLETLKASKGLQRLENMLDLAVRLASLVDLALSVRGGNPVPGTETVPTIASISTTTKTVVKTVTTTITTSSAREYRMNLVTMVAAVVLISVALVALVLAIRRLIG